MLVDYHVHTDYSLDANGSIVDYCQRALQIGVTEVCFTTHYDSDPQRSDNWVRVGGQQVSVRSDWLDSYFAEIERARQQFPGLFVGAGLEVDYAPELEAELGKMISGHPFDFVIGSVHCLKHLTLSERLDSQVYFTGRTARDVCIAYFRVVRLAVQSGLFDAIGHLDLFKRFGSRFYGSCLDEARKGLAEAVFEEMAQRQMALEVNSGGWRHACHEPYPSLALLSLAHDTGVQRITLGSDAHEVNHLADGINKAVIVAQEAGYSNFCTFRARQPVSRPFTILKAPAADQP